MLRVPDVADAAYDALAADSALTTLLGGAKVFAYVPEDTAAPYVVVLGGREGPWARETNDDSTREVDIDVDVWSNYRGTKEVDDLAKQAATTLLAHGSWTGLSGSAGVLFVESPRPTMELIEGTIWTRRRVTVRVYLG